MNLKDKEYEILDMLSEDDALLQYFFNKVSEAKWFIPLKERGYFEPEKAPVPVPAEPEGYYHVPEWVVLPYLEKVAKQLIMSQYEELINELLEIIKSVTEYSQNKHEKITNFRTWWFFTKILCNLTNEKIYEEIINLIPYWLDNNITTVMPSSDIAERLLPKFLTDKATDEDIGKAELIIKHLTELKSAPEGAGTGKLVVDPYHLQMKLRDNLDKIGYRCSEEVIIDLQSKLKNLLTDERAQTYTSLYNDRDYPENNPVEALKFIIKELLLVKLKHEKADQLINDFITDDYLLFPKLALFTLTRNADKYQDKIKEILFSEKGVDLLSNTLSLGDEIKHLLKSLKDLSHDDELKLQKQIEKAAEIDSYWSKEEIRKDYFKQAMYKALSHNSYFKELHDQLKVKTHKEAELHPAVGKAEGKWGAGPSPLDKIDILKKGNEELSNYIENFRTENFWDGPSVEGLADMLRAVATENPEKFIDDLKPFKKSRYLYVYSILRGFQKAWESKRDLEWDKLFSFIKEYISQEQFGGRELLVDDDGLGANHKWVAAQISELINAGCKSDEMAFDPVHNEAVQEVLRIIFDKLELSDKDQISDYMHYALNSAAGKAVRALIELSLRKARTEKADVSKGEARWDTELKALYEELLEKGVIEAYTYLGFYLINFFHYLDEKWIREQIESFIKERRDDGSIEMKDKDKWEAFMAGALSRMDQGVYLLMKDHYKFGATHKFKQKHSSKLLIGHISHAYRLDMEDESESLFKYLTDLWNPAQINEVIEIFWSRRGAMDQPQKEENKRSIERILEFWKLVYERYTGEDAKPIEDGDKRILSSIIKLTIFIPELDKNYVNWIKLSIPFVDDAFDLTFFLEYLDKKKDIGDKKQNAKCIADILLLMKDNDKYPTFKIENCLSLVEFLYHHPNDFKNDIASFCVWIFNINQKFYEPFKDLWSKYNP